MFTQLIFSMKLFKVLKLCPTKTLTISWSFPQNSATFSAVVFVCVYYTSSSVWSMYHFIENLWFV